MKSRITMRNAGETEVLRRVVARLQSSLNLSSDRCFLTFDQRSVNPTTAPDSGVFAYFISSSFPEIDQQPSYLAEDALIGVTAFNRSHSLDDSDRADSLIVDYDSNLLELKRRVLRALVGWNLANSADDALYIGSFVKAVRCGQPEVLAPKHGGAFFTFIDLIFSVRYYVDACSEFNP